MAFFRGSAPMIVSAALLVLFGFQDAHAQEPDLIFRKSTTFRLITPNDKLATCGVDDPVVQNVACHYTLPERGGVSGALGFAEQVSDVSLSCQQIGPISFNPDGTGNVATIYEQWQNGAQVTVWPQDQVGGPIQYPAKPFSQR